MSDVESFDDLVARRAKRVRSDALMMKARVEMHKRTGKLPKKDQVDCAMRDRESMKCVMLY